LKRMDTRFPAYDGKSQVSESPGFDQGQGARLLAVRSACHDPAFRTCGCWQWLKHAGDWLGGAGVQFRGSFLVAARPCVGTDCTTDLSHERFLRATACPAVTQLSGAGRIERLAVPRSIP